MWITILAKRVLTLVSLRLLSVFIFIFYLLSYFSKCRNLEGPIVQHNGTRDIKLVGWSVFGNSILMYNSADVKQFRGGEIRRRFPYEQLLDEILRNKYGFRPSYSIRKRRRPSYGGVSSDSDSNVDPIFGIIGGIVGAFVGVCCCIYRCSAMREEETREAQEKLDRNDAKHKAKADPNGVLADENCVPPSPVQHDEEASSSTLHENVQSAPIQQNVSQTMQQNDAQTGLATHNPLAVSEQGKNMNSV